MGSKEILNLKYRQGFAFVGVSGGQQVVEQRAMRETDRASVTQVFKMSGQAAENLKRAIVQNGCEDRVHQIPDAEKLSSGQQLPLKTELVKRQNNIDFYLSKKRHFEKIDKLKMFLDWCKTEGVVMPKLEYPVAFENGLVGARCKGDILNREAFLHVPYKMILDVKKVQNNILLKRVIEANP